MKKKLLYTLVILLSIACLFFAFNVGMYLHTQKKNEASISYCSQTNSDECYNKMFELALPKMLINKAVVNSEDAEFIKLDWQARFSEKHALDKSDLLISYGILNAIELESNYSEFFDKPAFCYDCGVKDIQPFSPKTKFYSECIGTDKFLVLGQVSSNKIHSFKQKFEELNLQDKQVYIKMDIAGAEAEVLPEILDYSDNISGFLITMHFRTPADIIDRLPILDKFNEKFVLLSRNSILNLNLPIKVIKSKYYKGNLNASCMVFSYVNKRYVDSYKVSFEQNTAKYYPTLKIVEPKKYFKKVFPHTKINPIVIFGEKLKKIYKDTCKTQH